MRSLARYFACLNTGRTILWCYLLWWACTVVLHFDARPRLWLTSLGLSAIIGTALVISTRTSSRGTTQLDRWQVFRLYLMPFCVSSFAALVKDAGYLLVFPPSWFQNALGFGVILAFLVVIRGLRRSGIS